MPKLFFSSIFLIIIQLIAPIHGAAQNIDSLLNLQRIADPQEKVYVHFDKAYYNPGETIWFKAYVFAGLDPSEISKTFYAELLDEKGNIIDKKTAPILGSGASSSFDLSATASLPLVYFRGYTINMLNSDTAFIFTKAITILVPTLAGKPRATVATPATIRFLPEGGDWVNGLSATMAYKVTGAKEMPLEASGTINDNDGKKVIDFATQLNGMGQVVITPQAGKTYTAFWKDQNGKQYTTPLPKPNTEGIVLQIKDEANSKRFTIQRSEGVSSAGKKLHLIASMNQHLVFSANINLSEKAATTGLLPVKDLPSGILQITVFDESYKPLAERVCFVNNHDYEFDADVFVPQKSMAKRGLNKAEIVITDTLAANFSISITDADLNETESYDDNIVSHLLLTGDLRGKIINPYYYFFSNSDSVGYHLDLVMLTHGWRRYNWDAVLAAKIPTKKWDEKNYLSIDGQVSMATPGGFSPGTQLTGIMKTIDSTTTIINLPVSRKGKIFSDGMIFYDYAKLYFSFSDKKMTFDKGMLTVNNGLRNGYKIATVDSSNKAETLLLDADIVARNIKSNAAELRLAELRKQGAVELQNVTVTAKAKTPLEKLDERYASGMFGGDARGFDLSNDPAAVASQSVFQYLQGRVAGLQINASQNPPTLTWRGSTPTLYLNEMRTDPDQLSNMNMNDIAYVKVFSPGQTGAISSSGGGAIVVYTKKGDDVKSDAKGLDHIQIAGYTPIKEFYTPDYATASSFSDGSDQRTTLYWNPTVVLNKNKKRFKFQFFNNDITRRYRLILEGINDEGRVFHVEKIVQ